MTEDYTENWGRIIADWQRRDEEERIQLHDAITKEVTEELGSVLDRTFAKLKDDLISEAIVIAIDLVEDDRKGRLR